MKTKKELSDSVNGSCNPYAILEREAEFMQVILRQTINYLRNISSNLSSDNPHNIGRLERALAAWEWVHAKPDFDYPFSFDCVCYVLQVDPEKMRDAVYKDLNSREVLRYFPRIERANL